MKNDKATVERFRNAIAALFASFGKEATDAIYRGYWIGLSDLEILQIEQAVAKALRTNRFCPTPAELREQLIGSPQERTELAWQHVQQALLAGPYKSVDFADKAIAATIRSMGGWPAFVMRFQSAEGEKWAKQEFGKSYTAWANRGVSDDAARPLRGLLNESQYVKTIRIGYSEQRRVDGDRRRIEAG